MKNIVNTNKSRWQDPNTTSHIVYLHIDEINNPQQQLNQLIHDLLKYDSLICTGNKELEVVILNNEKPCLKYYLEILMPKYEIER